MENTSTSTEAQFAVDSGWYDTFSFVNFACNRSVSEVWTSSQNQKYPALGQRWTKINGHLPGFMQKCRWPGMWQFVNTAQWRNRALSTSRQEMNHRTNTPRCRIFLWTWRDIVRPLYGSTLQHAPSKFTLAGSVFFVNVHTSLTYKLYGPTVSLPVHKNCGLSTKLYIRHFSFF